MNSILSTLGAGSGIDTAKLVSDLASASSKPRQNAIDARIAANNARLSAIAQFSSGLTTLATSSEQRLRSLADADIPSFVEDLVAAVNMIRGQINDAKGAIGGGVPAGPLSSDAGTRSLDRALSSLAGTTVAGTTGLTRLSDIGISTGRDGTLTLDSARLNAAVTANTMGVKTLLGVGSSSATGISKTLGDLRDAMVGSGGALTSSKATYDRATKIIATDQSKLTAQISAMTDRLTASFSAMDRQVAVIKASQAYLTQQIAVWTATK